MPSTLSVSADVSSPPLFLCDPNAEFTQAIEEESSPSYREPVEPRLPLRRLEETALGDGNSFVRAGARMKEIEAQAALVARSVIPLLILGESGTGKEVLAKYTHLMSGRGDGIFLKVNCAAMPADLLESELFGYEKGAFTGAIKDKPGSSKSVMEAPSFSMKSARCLPFFRPSCSMSCKTEHIPVSAAALP